MKKLLYIVGVLALVGGLIGLFVGHWFLGMLVAGSGCLLMLLTFIIGKMMDKNIQDGFDQGGEPDDKRALRDAIERLQEHDIVYHTIYGEGEVYDNSDVKLIEVRFGNDMRFLKKDQLVARREHKVVDEEDQAIARRRRRRTPNRK